MKKKVGEYWSNNQMSVDIAVMVNQVANIDFTVKDIQRKLEGEYVTQSEFEPVRKIVFGLVSLILIAVVGALVALVVQK